MAQELRYASMARRVQAATVDLLVFAGMFICFSLFISSLGIESAEIRLLAVMLPVFGYEPFLISSYGGTVGYYIFNQRVCYSNTGQNLNFFDATLRYVLKGFLGWFSLILMFTSRQHQALHDKATGSVVLIKDPTTERAEYALTERNNPANSYKVYGYVIGVYVILILAVNLLGD